MVGPSSSHTAGACRLGLLARNLVGGTPERARIELHGSFARTGEGHGTDKAIAGGLMGFRPDDDRIREALDIADRDGLRYAFEKTTLGDDADVTAYLLESGVALPNGAGYGLSPYFRVSFASSRSRCSSSKASETDSTASSSFARTSPRSRGSTRPRKSRIFAAISGPCGPHLSLRAQPAGDFGARLRLGA